MQEEEQEGEIDLNLQEYKKQRIIARRSPYPSVVIEVRAMAPPKFTPPPPTGPVSPKSVDDIVEYDSDGKSKEESSSSSEYVQQLEALFSKSSLDTQSKSVGNGSDNFYESIGSHIETFSSKTK